jgi:hypothetical protein
MIKRNWFGELNFLLWKVKYRELHTWKSQDQRTAMDRRFGQIRDEGKVYISNNTRILNSYKFNMFILEDLLCRFLRMSNQFRSRNLVLLQSYKPIRYSCKTVRQYFSSVWLIIIQFGQQCKKRFFATCGPHLNSAFL